MKEILHIAKNQTLTGGKEFTAKVVAAARSAL
jgi:hypothetical protein